jgi:hypothetical protein
MFNEFLRRHYLEAVAGQEECSRKSCVRPVWEGSKVCYEHFLEWTPDLISEDQSAMNELRSSFKFVQRSGF